MRRKLLVIATMLALVSATSATRGADTQALQRVLDQWAAAWSSNDVETLLPLFTNNVDYEDVTLGAVNHGSKALRDFAIATFSALRT
jgi:hypothetical protein